MEERRLLPRSACWEAHRLIPASSSGENSCARVDSNHHGPLSPQGPQPRTRPSYKS
jgi:hypothetical protein